MSGIQRFVRKPIVIVGAPVLVIAAVAAAVASSNAPSDDRDLFGPNTALGASASEAFTVDVTLSGLSCDVTDGETVHISGSLTGSGDGEREPMTVVATLHDADGLELARYHGDQIEALDPGESVAFDVDGALVDGADSCWARFDSGGEIRAAAQGESTDLLP